MVAKANTPIEFIDLPELMRRVSLSKSVIYREASAGRFPRPVKLTPKKAVWVAAEIEAWKAAKVEARG